MCNVWLRGHVEDSLYHGCHLVICLYTVNTNDGAFEFVEGFFFLLWWDWDVTISLYFSIRHREKWGFMKIYLLSIVSAYGWLSLSMSHGFTISNLSLCCLITLWELSCYPTHSHFIFKLNDKILQRQVVCDCTGFRLRLINIKFWYEGFSKIK